ncbi:MAG: hypothetical protein WCP33_02970 [Deltaproteobacteria bacterium]
MKPNKTCNCKEEHIGHICELESQQQWEAIKHVTNKPAVRCENCGTAANSGKFVCMPGEL